MNFFFCCMKRDKPAGSQNKPTKEALQTLMINEYLQRNSKKIKKEEDSSESKVTNAEEISNLSGEPLLNSPKLVKKFDLSVSLDAEAEDHYEYLNLERNSEEGWTLETNKEDLRIWIKMKKDCFSKDSKYQQNCPFVKSCFKLKLEENDDINQKNIFEALYDPEKRKQWDKSILIFENFDSEENKGCCKSYMGTKVPIVTNRDFLERRVVFRDLKNQEDVSVYWQIEDERYPKAPNFARAFTRIGGTIIKMKENNEIEITSLSQVDADLKGAGNVLRKMLPINMEKWFISLRNFLKITCQKPKS